MISKKSLIITIAIVIILNLIFLKTSNVLASNIDYYISLSDNYIMVNNEEIPNDSNKNIYVSKITDNGGISKESIEANIEIKNIININSSGTYEFTGQLSDGQISINANEANGKVIIILNNVDITCENAPAILIYNTETKSSSCEVIIKTAKDSKNTISGGKIKQSVKGWSDQSEILYYIEKAYNDEGEYYERYKYDGAISSDISLTFEGEGTLIVNSISKEGIEAKRDITINSGDYTINSLDDGINACADNESIITINGGTIRVNVLEEAEEGDGIDSNGYIYINGGTIYSFASEKSQDSGLDSDLGIYINGGIVLATGNMADSVSKESKQTFMQIQFKEKVLKDTLITITDESKNPIIAFKSDREYETLTISSPDFEEGKQYIYEGGDIEGISNNGVYTQIDSYSGGTEKEYNEVAEMRMPNGLEQNIKSMGINNNIYYYIIIILLLILLILIIVYTKLKNKKVLTLFIGMIIGAIITTSCFMVYNKIVGLNANHKMINDQIQENGKGPNERLNGEPPEKPNSELGSNI